MSRAGRSYLAISAPAAALLPLAPHALRPWYYLLLSLTTLLAVGSYLPRLAGRDRLPWALLAASMAWLAGANLVQIVNSGLSVLVALFPASYLLMLAAAITLVLRRGRNDIGGMLDVSVATIGLSGVLWTVLLAPRLDRLHVAAGQRVTLLVTILVLAGLLGCLGRLVAVGGLPALYLLGGAIICVLAANVAQGMLTGSTYGAVPGWVDLLFAGPYLACGLLALSRSADQLVVAGPAPVDRLSTARLVFLGAAFALNPVAAGVVTMAGAEPDGLLLVLGVLLTAPLVLLRIGRVARERSRAELALRRQASHDPLTGLPNRAELHHRLAGALARDRPVVLLFGDLDGFKAVNDRLGHVAGDDLLVQVGARIRAVLPPGATVFRYGGDEFLILCDDPDTARLMAGAVAEPFTLAAGRVGIGISIGTVVAGASAGADELIRQADQAMYRAKKAARVPAGSKVATA